MTDAAPTLPPPPTSLPELSGRMADEAGQLDKELAEVDLLIAQATTEAARHETRRATAADKLKAAVAASTAAGSADPPTNDLSAQLVLLTKRAALMESQVDVLEGKRRALGRYREAVGQYAEALERFGDIPIRAGPATGKARGTAAAAGSAAADPSGVAPAVSRLLLGAQEDLRREIARAMHDGPAQSLTNIVLQAQIVDHLVTTDPTKAGAEVRQLVAMVQQTLEATKSFIFDVRPMVLDDLGLVPTLRRAARERGRRAGIPIEFDSTGPDRRLPMDLESGLFRILDEAMAAYLGARADRISVRLDWADEIEARVAASRTVVEARSDPGLDVASTADKDLPPALAAMMEDRRADARQAAEAARRDAIVVLPPSTWREIQLRAATLGMVAELSADGSELRLITDAPPADPEG